MKERPLSEAILDQARMQGLLDDLGADAAEVIEIFLADVPNQLVTLQNAWTVHDSQTYQRIAHGLKSSAGIFGAAALVELCRVAQSADFSAEADFAHWLAQMTAAFGEAQTVLLPYIALSKNRRAQAGSQASGVSMDEDGTKHATFPKIGI